MSVLQELLTEIGNIGKSNDGGRMRTGLSPESWLAAQAVAEKLTGFGAQADVDRIGNAHGRLPGISDKAGPIVIGSHIDTVIDGGLYDGMLGVAASIDVLRRLKEDGIRLRHPLEVWGFNMEESSILGGTFGSRAVLGLVDTQKKVYRDNLQHFGISAEDVLASRVDSSGYSCFIEYHIEQGDKLFNTGTDLGIVSGIVGIVRYTVTADGISNHAGTTMMSGRHDALVGMSRLILKAEELARTTDDTLVCTVGKMSVLPGQENVIPGQVTATFEARHMNAELLSDFFLKLEKIAADIENCSFRFEKTTDKHSTKCAEFIIDAIEACCIEKGTGYIHMPSGAGHDANAMALAGVPSGMIFVPSENGISHQKDEFTQDRHVDLGGEILYRTVLRLDRELE